MRSECYGSRSVCLLITALAASASVHSYNQRYIRFSLMLLLDFEDFRKTLHLKVMA